MYIRFVSPLRTRRRGVDYGIFACAYQCWRDQNTPDYLRDAIRAELNWFEKSLPVPGFGNFYIKSKKRWYADGICWFRSDADTMIKRAYALQALLAECGWNISTNGTYEPGQILYRDEYQIVAKPGSLTPTRWH